MPDLEPAFWYELLVGHDDPQSEVWFATVEQALAGIRVRLERGEARDKLRLSWESRAGETGLVAEARHLPRGPRQPAVVSFARRPGRHLRTRVSRARASDLGR